MIARNTTPVAFPGSPLHLAVEFCANPPAYAARWLHGDLVYTPGKKYGDDVLAYGFIVSNSNIIMITFMEIGLRGPVGEWSPEGSFLFYLITRVKAFEFHFILPSE